MDYRRKLTARELCSQWKSCTRNLPESHSGSFLYYPPMERTTVRKAVSGQRTPGAVGVTEDPMSEPVHRLARRATLESRKPKSLPLLQVTVLTLDGGGGAASFLRAQKTKLISLSALVKASHIMETTQSYRRRKGKVLINPD